MQQKDLYNLPEKPFSELILQDFLRCNSFEQELNASKTFISIKKELLDAGMLEEDFDELINLLNAIARRCIEEELPITAYNQN